MKLVEYIKLRRRMGPCNLIQFGSGLYWDAVYHVTAKHLFNAENTSRHNDLVVENFLKIF